MNNLRLFGNYVPYFFLIACFYACGDKTAVVQSTEPRTFYISHSGDDHNTGSLNAPWKSIQKLNSIRLGSGDSVCFEGGQLFTGNIVIDSADHGKKGNAVTLTSYGKGKATIDGENGTALIVSQTGFITVTNISFKGAGRKTGNTKDGVSISRSANIIVDSIDVTGFQKSGLLIHASNDVVVKNVYAFNNGFAGISISGTKEKKDCRNIHISHCRAENNPGDPANFTNHSGNGILAGLCRNVVIEYCTATNNGWDMPRRGNGPVGIWCYEADSVTIQHCISYRNKTSSGSADGGGFDLDGGVTNSVIQYCLSYENEGSGFGIFQYAGASNWYNNTIRFCISENDGSVSPAHAGIFIWNSSMDTNQFRNCYFYNNVIYNAKGAAIHYEPQSANTGFCFYNNIFVARDTLIFGKETNSTYLGNNWYSLNGTFNAEGFRNFKDWSGAKHKEIYNGKTVGFNTHPQFKNPGVAGVVLPSGLSGFDAYQLPANSVLRHGGLDLKKLFGIGTGDKAFNQSPPPSTGIGAVF